MFVPEHGIEFNATSDAAGSVNNVERGTIKKGFQAVIIEIFTERNILSDEILAIQVVGICNQNDKLYMLFNIFIFLCVFFFFWLERNSCLLSYLSSRVDNSGVGTNFLSIRGTL